MKENLARIIGIMFMSRTYAHMAHLKTESFAAHKALDEFYSALPDQADKLAEIVQGSLGVLDIPVEPQTGDVTQPLEGLKQHLITMEQLIKDCEVGYIVNVFEEIQALYTSTFYKLTILK